MIRFRSRIRCGGGGSRGGASVPFFAGSTLDMLFNEQRYRGATAANLTTSRAAAAYADDEAGNWVPFSANTPRITSKGLLIEEARTNSIRNNSMQGVVAGSPGTLPTNWSVGAPVGISRQIVGVETINGVEFLRIRFFGTVTVTNSFTIGFDAINAIAALQNQTWTGSLFYQLLTGTGIGSNLFLDVWEYDAGSGFLSTGSSPTILTSDTTLQRLTNVRTLPSATTAFARLVLRSNSISAGTPVDFEVRLGWPQLEQGAFATSPIRTTSAAVTRDVDVVSLTGAPFTTVFTGGVQGTLFAEAAILDPNTANTDTIFGVDDGTVANRIALRSPRSGPVVASLIVAASVTQAASSVSSVFATGQVARAALAYNTNDIRVAANNVLGAQQTTVTIPTGLTGFQFGQPMGAQILNGYLRRAAYFPTRLVDGSLQAITA